MEIPVPIAVLVATSVIALLVYIWKIKTEMEPREKSEAFNEWKEKHEMLHETMARSIKENSGCIVRLKMDVSKIETRCPERMNVLTRILEVLDSLQNKLEVTNNHTAKTQSDIEVLKAELKLFTRPNNWSGEERRNQ